MTPRKNKMAAGAAADNVAAVIVTYRVTPDFAANLEAIAPQVNHVVIVDNGSDAPAQRWLADLAGRHGGEVTLMLNAENSGLAAAQNQGIRRALETGSPWILLLDDDSRAEPGMVRAMLDAYRANPERARVGIVTPRIRDVHGGFDYPCLTPWRRFGFRRTFLPPGDGFLNGLFCALASGSLIRHELFEHVSPMREDFFIDFVDWDFCARVQRADWRIMAAGGALLHHALGRKTSHRFLGAAFRTSNHPPERRYTAARNRAAFWRLHGTALPCAASYTFLAMLKEIWLILAFEREKLAKFRAVLHGTREGLTMKLPRSSA